MSIYFAAVSFLGLYGCNGSLEDENVGVSKSVRSRPSSHDLFAKLIVKNLGSCGTFEDDFKASIAFTEHFSITDTKCTSHSLRKLRESTYSLLRNSSRFDTALMEQVFQTILVFRLLHVAGDLVMTAKKNKQGIYIDQKILSVGSYQYMALAKTSIADIVSHSGHYSNIAILFDFENYTELIKFCKGGSRPHKTTIDCSTSVLQLVLSVLHGRITIPVNASAIDPRVGKISWEPMREFIQFIHDLFACKNLKTRELFRDKFLKYIRILPRAIETPRADIETLSADLTNSNFPAYLHLIPILKEIQLINALPTPKC